MSRLFAYIECARKYSNTLKGFSTMATVLERLLGIDIRSKDAATELTQLTEQLRQQRAEQVPSYKPSELDYSIQKLTVATHLIESNRRLFSRKHVNCATTSYASVCSAAELKALPSHLSDLLYFMLYVDFIAEAASK